MLLLTPKKSLGKQLLLGLRSTIHSCENDRVSRESGQHKRPDPNYISSTSSYLGGIRCPGNLEGERRAGHVLAGVLDGQRVPAGLLRFDVQRERRVAVVVELAVGDLVGADAVGSQLAGPGPPRVDEALDLLADDAVLEPLARADDEARVGRARHAHLQGTALQLAAVPGDGHQQWVRGERGVARPVDAVS